MKMKYYQIPHQKICKADLKSCFESLKGTARLNRFTRIDKLTDSQMEEIARRMGNSLVNDTWWTILESITHEIIR